MALTYAQSLVSSTWQQTQTNTGFDDTVQGPESFAFSISHAVGASDANVIFAKEDDIAISSSVNIDLSAAVDFFNNSNSFARVYSLVVSATGGSLTLSPGASNGLEWFFGSATDSITIQDGSAFMICETLDTTVDATHKILTLTNPSGVDVVTYKIAIIGGV